MAKRAQPAKSAVIGYARVSTQDQNLDMQVEVLKRFPCDEVFVEKKSASADRLPIRAAVFSVLRPGDRIVFYAVDRLGRSMRDLLRCVDFFTENGIKWSSVTQSVSSESIETPAGMMMFHMMAMGAQFERDLIRKRTQDGVEAAVRRGVKFGQPAKLDPKRQAATRQWRHDGMTVRGIADRVKTEFGITISPAAISKYTKTVKGAARRRRAKR